MREEAYRKRLSDDLRHWREQGWVTEHAAEAILSSLPKRAHWAVSWVTILGALGAILFGAGVVAFVSANWEAMPHLVRLGLLIGGLAASFLVGAVFAGRNRRLFADMALLVAGFFFAGTIAFVAQTYHLSGDLAGAVVLWVIGMYGAAILTGSPVMTVMALIGGGYWTWLRLYDGGLVVDWAGLVAVLVGVALTLRFKPAYARLIAALALGYWLIITILAHSDHFDWSGRATMAPLAATALAYWAIGAVLSGVGRWTALAEFGRMMILPALLALLVALGLMQIDDASADAPGLWLVLAGLALVVAVVAAAVALLARRISIVDFVVAAAIGLAAIGYAYWYPGDVIQARLAAGLIVLGAALFVTNLGETGPLQIGKRLGLTAFGLEVIYLYTVTLGTLMDTAIAFLLGGVLFIALAFGFYRLNRYLSRREEAAP